MERNIEVNGTEIIGNVFGSFDENIKLIENELDVAVVNRDGKIKVCGGEENTESAEKVIKLLISVAERGETVTAQIVSYFISMVEEGNDAALADFSSDCVCITAKGRPIRAKTLGQKQYLEAIENNTVTLGVGPAGTGKTYLAVAMAVTALRNKQVSRIILTRPAVEAGENLGFLPGDLQNKVDPYLRPLYDVLSEMFGVEAYQRLIERGAIEIAPLAYMRGRTLSDSFIILDEAQNTTVEQMKMFLTRMGENSKMVITGDVTQVDLPAGKTSGLKNAVEVLDGVDGIEIIKLTHKDVVRHPLVAAIIRAYEKNEKLSAKISAESDKGNYDERKTENRE